MSRETQIRHATCVAIAGAGVLILGPSGSGKSDLALRLVDGGGALLVADDAVLLSPVASPNGAYGVLARAPAALAGLLEVRGVGILPVPHAEAVRLALVVRLGGAAAERLPDPETETLSLVDAAGRERAVSLPLIRLAAFEASAPAKLRLALAAVRATGLGTVPGVPDRFERVPAEPGDVETVS